ncbi:MAG: DUF484 family protein [Albidovulum sp.]|uniref:DUF484 family protein n=1 Tax=Albidovulum sp. TaxID=1872424 RepID=UPI003CA6F01F
MADTATIANDIRDKLLAEPEVILEDRDLMKALIRANERAMGANIVDLRGIAMERLEARLDRLEDTHRSVIAAAYENLAGTNQIHRAILSMLEPAEFEDFLLNLGQDVAQILRVDCVRLVLETAQTAPDPVADRLNNVLCVVEPGFVDAYMSGGRSSQARPVVLRQTQPDQSTIYGESGAWVRSEAALRLDLGAGRLPGILALGSEDPHLFRSNQGTDLLTFFASAFERAMRRWLA